MIKHAEVQNAYLLGRQAAMIKLAEGEMSTEEVQRILQEETPNIPITVEEVAAQPEIPGTRPSSTSMYQRALAGLRSAGANQLEVLHNIGITGQGLTRGDKSLAAYDPRQLATLENLSRAGMLAGSAGGAHLGGYTPRAAGLALAGSLGGGLVGGNLGQGVNEAIKAFGYDGDRRTATAIGGALGGLGGGLGAGYLA